MYGSEPRIRPSEVGALTVSVRKSRRARPKSRMCGRPSASMRILPGFKSRWQTPCSMGMVHHLGDSRHEIDPLGDVGLFVAGTTGAARRPRRIPLPDNRAVLGGCNRRVARSLDALIARSRRPRAGNGARLPADRAGRDAAASRRRAVSRPDRSRDRRRRNRPDPTRARCDRDRSDRLERPATRSLDLPRR